MNQPAWPPLDSSFAPADTIPQLAYGDVELRFAGILPGDPDRGFVPGYHFLIVSQTGAEVGHINFRVGETLHLLNTAGHIGFNVREEHRGHGYAYQACRALEPFTRRHYAAMVLTADPENQPSLRTIEKLGAEFINEVDVPPHEPAYQRGERRKRRYKWVPRS
jgi:predicted acetyltransferase